MINFIMNLNQSVNVCLKYFHNIQISGNVVSKTSNVSRHLEISSIVKIFWFVFSYQSVHDIIFFLLGGLAIKCFLSLHWRICQYCETFCWKSSHLKCPINFPFFKMSLDILKILENLAHHMPQNKIRWSYVAPFVLHCHVFLESDLR